MNDNGKPGCEEFVIKNGILKRYNGAGGDVTVPDGVSRIGKRAFFCCIELESVTLPSGVTKIGDEAFSSCLTLKSVRLPDSVTEIGTGAFCN